MKYLNGFLLFIVCAMISTTGMADIVNVMLRPGNPVNPTNLFMSCLKDRILNANPNFDFGGFPGTEMTYDESTPHLLAKTDVTLKERASGKLYLFKVVLTSTDTVNGWQTYMDASGITIWSKQVAESVTFSRSPDQSPIISTFSIKGCPASE